MLKISKVKRKSIAKSLGLETGDEILSFNDFPCVDELDYLYYAATSEFTMTVRDCRTGEQSCVRVQKAEDEDLGLEFEKNACLATCQNRCVFCFVDQMPKGMRQSLYVKDDDYGMSFTCGNFVTLTNLSNEQLERIIRLRLSPLYVSVHTLNGALREKLMRNRFAGKIVGQIQTLAKNGIAMHCQAVIVPNENVGEELAYTARQLFQYYPTVRDLACVPTGLTKYRDGLPYIPDVDGEYSARLLDLVERLNEEFGVPFVLPADEYFVKAEREVYDAAFYGDFSQIENGIGLTRKFLDDAAAALDGLKVGFALKKPKKSLLICGDSAAKTLRKLVQRCNAEIGNLQAELLPVKNEFFGETVTCTGLLTGKDVVAAVEEYRKKGGSFDELVLAGNMLKEFEDVFLCGMTLAELETRLGAVIVRVNRDGGRGFVQTLCGVGKRRR